MTYRRLAALAAGAALIAAGAAQGAAAAGRGHDVVYLVEQTGPSTYAPTENYVVVEGSDRDALIRREQHGTQTGQVDWTTFADVGDDATEHSDFHPDTGTANLDPVTVPGEAVNLSTLDDASIETTETFTLKLSNPRGEPGMILRTPYQAKVSIIDVDGTNRVSLGNDEYSNFENRGSVRLLVVRSGPVTTVDTSVNYTTAPGTATQGSDYSSRSGTLFFPAGGNFVDRTETITVPLLNDGLDEPSETFTVTLSSPSGGGATLGTPVTATVTIEDDDSPSSDTTDPVTSFHIPRHNRTYGLQSSVRNTAHISPSDDGSGIARVDFALRKKMRNGDCSWYNGTRFRAGGCFTKRWIDAGLDEQCPNPDQCFIVVDYADPIAPLKQTTRATGIASYTVFSRAADNAGNVEDDFNAGRNANTFYIKPS